MNEIVNKFLLVGDKFMPDMHLRQPGFTCSACGSFTKNKDSLIRIKKKFKDLKKQAIQNIFTKMNWIKPAFNIIWLMEILKI